MAKTRRFRHKKKVSKYNKKKVRRGTRRRTRRGGRCNWQSVDGKNYCKDDLNGKTIIYDKSEEGTGSSVELSDPMIVVSPNREEHVRKAAKPYTLVRRGFTYHTLQNKDKPYTIIYVVLNHKTRRGSSSFMSSRFIGRNFLVLEEEEEEEEEANLKNIFKDHYRSHNTSSRQWSQGVR